MHKRGRKGINIIMFKKVFRQIAWWVALIATFAYTLAFALPSLLGGSEGKDTPRAVLSVWHVDTFEGGKGSRASFLKKVAQNYERQTEGVTVLVQAMTKTGVEAAFAEGRAPDLLSYGIGVSVNASEAHCWCEGRYALYSLSEDFNAVSAENTVLSSGGENLPAVAAALAGLSGELTVKSSTTAYVEFLNGKYAYLLGTQRDASRFEVRGVSVYCLPLKGFSDLRQYVSVVKTENKKLANAFIGYLLAEESQKLLTGIGMFSALYDVYSSDDGMRKMLEDTKPTYTLSPFIGGKAREEAGRCAVEALRVGNAEVLKKFLKVRSNTFKL